MFPEQKAKIKKYHTSIDNELVIPTAAARRLNAKEVTKKNCLVPIAKNLNLTKPASDDARCIKELLGEKLIVNIYFIKAQGKMHNGTTNIEVLNPAIYKKFVKTIVKQRGKHVKMMLHPRSIDSTKAPNEYTLKEFGFLDVNTTIANAVVTLANAPVAKLQDTINRSELEHYVKDALAESSYGDLTQLKQDIREEVREDIREELQDFKQDIVSATQAYTNNLTEKLKLELNSQFETIMMTLNNTRKMLDGDTPK